MSELSFFSRKSTADHLGQLFGSISLFVGAISGYLTAELAKTFLPPLLLALGILNIVVVVAYWKKARRDENGEAANGWLVAACRIIEIGIVEAYKATNGTEPDVCVAVYIPEGPNILVQVVEMGREEDSGRRRITRGCGAVGTAAKTKAPQVGSRNNPDLSAFRDQLRLQYNLPLDIVNTVRENMWSWIAVPLFAHDRRRILMVVFIDADQADCFKLVDLSSPGNPTGISAVAMRLCSGIADHFVEYE